MERRHWWWSGGGAQPTPLISIDVKQDSYDVTRPTNWVRLTHLSHHHTDWVMKAGGCGCEMFESHIFTFYTRIHLFIDVLFGQIDFWWCFVQLCHFLKIARKSLVWQQLQDGPIETIGEMWLKSPNISSRNSQGGYVIYFFSFWSKSCITKLLFYLV